MNGLSLLLVVAIVIGVVVAYRAGVARGARATRGTAPLAALTSDPTTRGNARSGNGDSLAEARAASAAAEAEALPAVDVASDTTISHVASAPSASAARVAVDTALAAQAPALAEERHALFRALADARGETARYRQLVVDLENDAPPPLLDSPAAPDDLKLIVGIGPVLERMLQQMGVSRYRQIARWTERDIDEFDARLPEFPGRIRRDAWVTQARALHQSKYGEALPPR